MKLTISQWNSVQHFLPPMSEVSNFSIQRTLEGILHVLQSDFHWEGLPQEYPPYELCRASFYEWTENGTLKSVIRALVRNLYTESQIDLTQSYVFGMHFKNECDLIVNFQEHTHPWELSTLSLFLNPYPLRILHDLRLESLEQKFGRIAYDTYLSELQVTLLTVMIHVENLGEDIRKGRYIPIQSLKSLDELDMDQLFNFSTLDLIDFANEDFS